VKARLYLNKYSDPDPVRADELDDCLIRNATLRGLDEVVLLQGRPTFGDVLRRIERDAGPDDVSVFLNSDIYLDVEAVALMREHVRPNELWALTRYEVDPDGSTHLRMDDASQDTWVLRGRPAIPGDVDFRFGVLGCDNSFACRMFRAGLHVSKPTTQPAGVVATGQHAEHGNAVNAANAHDGSATVGSSTAPTTKEVTPQTSPTSRPTSRPQPTNERN
jgi:hypothetical protein